MLKAKKTIAAALIALMTVTMIQVPVFAETETGEGDDIQTSATAGETETTESTESTSSTEPTETESTQTEAPSSSSKATTATKATTTKATTKASGTKTAAPARPAIRVLKDGPGLKVTWNTVSGADYYAVYRSYQSGKRGTFLKNVKGKTVYRDKAVASGKRAYYTVRAHKAKGGFTAYSKQVSNVIFRVFIETGHGIDARGRWDPGCTWKKYQEAKLMIPIAKATTKYLRSKGVYVYTDAYSGNNRNLKWLCKNIKNYKVSVLVNIHCDYKLAPKGTLALYKYSEQKKLATSLNKAVHKTVKMKNRGVKKRKNLMSLNKTKKYCVACLFETGNIKKDNRILRKQYDAYGKGLAMGVCNYLGVKW